MATEKELVTIEKTDKLVYVNRTSKVVKGGRKFSFSAIVVVGDGNGEIGYGNGKANEVPAAIQKAMESARRNRVRIAMKGSTLQHEIIGRHGATKVFMKPASDGTGIIAGSAMRAVFEVMGIKNILSKVIGSSNPMNVVRATINGLTSMATPETIADKRGKTVEEIVE
ncbi:MAG: 30S ribosomal protein S5 [Gammaproteobacteria bacterium]|nr:30S ribosomal protein S5 [Gammaproteobacteria bacterium]